jgi:hypothetical protein|tara:strand:- start:456 stop:1727 length:1272 start_codon:yes stop_codon:yes gene_type:complete
MELLNMKRWNLKWNFVIVLGASSILSACGSVSNEESSSPESYLYVWQFDPDENDDPNFLSVINSDLDSENYGALVTTVPTPDVRGGAHHTSLVLPSSGFLFANDYKGNSSSIFDTRNTAAPIITQTFKNKGNYNYAHTFSELGNGNILGVFQTQDFDNPIAGGLVEMTTDGNVVQTGDANSSDPDIFIRPYGLTMAPEHDRAMTTNFDMLQTGLGEHIQIWELSSLTLIASIAMPEAPDQWRQNPYEARLMANGKSVMFNTLRCGLFVLEDITAAYSEIHFVHSFEGAEICALPVRSGNYWLQTTQSQTNPDNNAIVVLDVHDPLQPVEVSRLIMGSGFFPHWMSPDITGSRIVLTGNGEHLSRRVMILNFDEATATLSIDPRFGAGDEFGSGVMLDRQVWPHGETGPASAHGAVFWPPAFSD